MLVGIGLGLFIFLVAILSFYFGLKFGKSLSDGVIPVINPIKIHKVNVEKKKVKSQDDLMNEGIRNIMTYTGDPQ